METLLLASLAAPLFFGAMALVFSRFRASVFFGVAGPVAAAATGLIPALAVMLNNAPLVLRFTPGNALYAVSLELDALSAVFLFAILLVCALSAVYGAGYMEKYRGKRNTGPSWFFLNVLVFSMALVCLARHALLFLLAWEAMALSSFFLVAFESERTESRKAAWVYLVASQLGTAFLLPMFLILADAAGTLEFGAVVPGLTPLLANTCFFLALVGFGTKAGVMPFHVWLPEAHPAAPSHVSAIMSGVMIKTGIYGLVRIILTLGTPPLFWGWTLVALGAVSGVLGVLFALAQHDLKRLLAYHSVENIGIILLGLGAGLIGLSMGSPLLAGLGFAGALMHVVNHALFKGLLFMGAGAVINAAHTREMDHLGGLLRKMPFTALFFLVGAMAITGLPPFNGFVSEFLVFTGSFAGAASLPAPGALPLLISIASLALIGGLAAACFTKAFGIVFLGAPRTPHVGEVKEAGALMTIPMALLALLCLCIGFCGPAALKLLSPAVMAAAGPGAALPLLTASSWLFKASVVFAGLVLLAALVWAARKILLSGRSSGKTVTWDCGYAAPTERMQYSASSFAQPITDLFGLFLRTRKTVRVGEGYFPEKASLETETPDFGREGLFRPVFGAAERFLSRFRVLQEGRLQIYVLYIVATLLALLIWKVR